MYPAVLDPEDPGDGAPDADRLLCATLYLMSCHARTRCPRLAGMIGRHLELIARCPQAGTRIAMMAKQLTHAWQAIGHDDERCFQASALAH